MFGRGRGGDRATRLADAGHEVRGRVGGRHEGGVPTRVEHRDEVGAAGALAQGGEGEVRAAAPARVRAEQRRRPVRVARTGAREQEERGRRVPRRRAQRVERIEHGRAGRLRVRQAHDVVGAEPRVRGEHRRHVLDVGDGAAHASLGVVDADEERPPRAAAHVPETHPDVADDGVGGGIVEARRGERGVGGVVLLADEVQPGEQHVAVGVVARALLAGEGERRGRPFVLVEVQPGATDAVVVLGPRRVEEPLDAPAAILEHVDAQRAVVAPLGEIEGGEVDVLDREHRAARVADELRTLAPVALAHAGGDRLSKRIEVERLGVALGERGGQRRGEQARLPALPLEADLGLERELGGVRGEQQRVVARRGQTHHLGVVVGVEHERLVPGRQREHRLVQLARADAVHEPRGVLGRVVHDQVVVVAERRARRALHLGDRVPAERHPGLVVRTEPIAEGGEGGEDVGAGGEPVEQRADVLEQSVPRQHVPEDARVGDAALDRRHLPNVLADADDERALSARAPALEPVEVVGDPARVLVHVVRLEHRSHRVRRAGVVAAPRVRDGEVEARLRQRRVGAALDRALERGDRVVEVPRLHEAAPAADLPLGHVGPRPVGELGRLPVERGGVAKAPRLLHAAGEVLEEPRLVGELGGADLAGVGHQHGPVEAVVADGGVLGRHLAPDVRPHVVEQLADADAPVLRLAAVPVGLAAHALDQEVREDAVPAAPGGALAGRLVVTGRGQHGDAAPAAIEGVEPGAVDAAVGEGAVAAAEHRPAAVAGVEEHHDALGVQRVGEGDLDLAHRHGRARDVVGVGVVGQEVVVVGPVGIGRAVTGEVDRHDVGLDRSLEEGAQVPGQGRGARVLVDEQDELVVGVAAAGGRPEEVGERLGVAVRVLQVRDAGRVRVARDADDQRPAIDETGVAARRRPAGGACDVARAEFGARVQAGRSPVAPVSAPVGAGTLACRDRIASSATSDSSTAK